MQTREQLIERLMFCFVNFRKGIGHATTGSHKILPLAQGEAFFVISHAKSLSVGALARHLSVTPGAATQLVEPLVTMGYVQRAQDSDDRRTTNLKLSAAGEAYRKKFRVEKTRHVTEIMEELDDTELQTLTELLEKVASSVNNKKEKEKR